MVEDTPETPRSTKSLWANLIFQVVTAQKQADDPSQSSAVERQTENSRKGGTIWEAVRKADHAALERLLKEDRNNANARGPVGECPIHMLFLYGTEAHLSMARYLITHFPHTITQVYNQSVREMSMTDDRRAS